MSGETTDKVMRYCFAGCCGILGFIGAYWLTGILFLPLEDWVIKKLG